MGIGNKILKESDINAEKNYFKYDWKCKSGHYFIQG